MALYVKDARGKTVLDYARSPGHEETARVGFQGGGNAIYHSLGQRETDDFAGPAH